MNSDNDKVLYVRSIKEQFDKILKLALDNLRQFNYIVVNESAFENYLSPMIALAMTKEPKLNELFSSVYKIEVESDQAQYNSFDL